MTTPRTEPPRKLAELLETLPPEERKEITAWLLSSTLPRTLPLLDCAQADARQTSSASTTRAVLQFLMFRADLLIYGAIISVRR